MCFWKLEMRTLMQSWSLKSKVLFYWSQMKPAELVTQQILEILQLLYVFVYTYIYIFKKTSTLAEQEICYLLPLESKFLQSLLSITSLVHAFDFTIMFAPFLTIFSPACSLCRAFCQSGREDPRRLDPCTCSAPYNALPTDRRFEHRARPVHPLPSSDALSQCHQRKGYMTFVLDRIRSEVTLSTYKQPTTLSARCWSYRPKLASMIRHRYDKMISTENHTKTNHRIQQTYT